MKIGIVGAGAVGSACAIGVIHRAAAREVVLVDRDHRRAAAVAAQRSTGNAELLDVNAALFKEIVPQVVAVVPDAILMVVTDPPDPLADLTRRLSPHGRVLSAGTVIDSLRLRVHIAQRLGVAPDSSAGCLSTTSKHVSSVRSDMPTSASSRATMPASTASGMVCAHLAQAMLRDERVVFPVGSYHEKYGVTLSLPSVVGRDGVASVVHAAMSDVERRQLSSSVDRLSSALSRLDLPRTFEGTAA